MNDKYWDGVVSNMKENDRVRFGKKGNGTRPNYQIISSDGTKKTFRGQNHEPDTTHKYHDRYLTDGYTLSEIKNHKFKYIIEKIIKG